MVCPAALAQIPNDGEGPGWSYLFYLAVFIILPLINALKDKFVERAEKKRAQADSEQLRLPHVPDGRPGESRLPSARRLEPGQRTRQAPRRPAAGPMPDHDVGPAPMARPAARPSQPARPAPSPPAEKPQVATVPVAKRPPAKAKKPAAPAARPERPAAARAHVAGVDVHAADPCVRVQEGDPKGRVHDQVEAIRARPARPSLRVGDAARTGTVEPVPVTVDLVSGPVSVAEMRRAIVLSEILQPPVALRGVRWQPPPML